MELTLVERLGIAVHEGAIEADLGFAPNFHRLLTCSPLAFFAAREMETRLESDSSLSSQERQLVMLAISAENSCEYCVATHYLLAASVGAPTNAILAARARATPTELRVGALVKFAREAVCCRGMLSDAALTEFAAAGFSGTDALDVVAIIAFKTFANYVNHIAQTPLDPGLRAMR